MGRSPFEQRKSYIIQNTKNEAEHRNTEKTIPFISWKNKKKSEQQNNEGQNITPATLAKERLIEN